VIGGFGRKALFDYYVDAPTFLWSNNRPKSKASPTRRTFACRESGCRCEGNGLGLHDWLIHSIRVAQAVVDP
jgi:hypothetical protein